MSPEPDRKEPQPRSINELKPSLSGSGWLGRITRKLSISTKIRCGYALALSIAVLGTTVGLTLGSLYEAKANSEVEKWHEAGVTLGNLQVAVLQARSHQQQFIPLLQDPKVFQQEHTHFLTHIARIKTILSEIQSSQAILQVKGMKQLLQTYEETTDNYLQQIETLLKQIEPLTLKPEEIPEAQRLLLAFTNSATALELDSLSDELSEIKDGAFDDEEKAHAARELGEAVQMYTPIASMLLSVAIATLLAIYTSRAIARPLKETTELAQRVIQEKNFELQVPVTTADEVGILATTLNQLLSKVRELLEEQKAAAERQQQMQEEQLLQSEKMSSLGRMMAGVAHEINNPVNFIYGNVDHASEYVEDILELLKTYQTEIPHPPQAVEIHTEEIELDFLEEDLPKVLQSIKLGSERVRQIILSLKDFSRLDESEVHPVDLHACIDSTLLILHNRVKKGIKVVRNYGDIPVIEGYAGLLYQVFMNLLSNAIDALEEQISREVEGVESSFLSTASIVITTESQDKDWVTIRIADNGSGIPPENLKKIFDTFFTTKPRGIGTGLGLAISRQIVEEKHGGQLTCVSQMGEGTEFAIALPIKRQIATDLSPQNPSLIAANT